VFSISPRRTCGWDSLWKTDKGQTIVVFSGNLDRVLAAFVIANGAAAMGHPVTMFFTFWGLNALRKKRSGCSIGCSAFSVFTLLKIAGFFLSFSIHR